MPRVKRKVKAAGGGSSVAGSLVIVFVALTGWDPDAEVISALTTLVGTAGGFLSGYMAME